MLLDWKVSIIYFKYFFTVPKGSSSNFLLHRMKELPILFNAWRERTISQQEPNFAVVLHAFNTACVLLWQTVKNRNENGTLWPFGGCLPAAKQFSDN